MLDENGDNDNDDYSLGYITKLFSACLFCLCHFLTHSVVLSMRSPMDLALTRLYFAARWTGKGMHETVVSN
jgi:hypothetical protein